MQCRDCRPACRPALSAQDARDAVQDESGMLDPERCLRQCAAGIRTHRRRIGFSTCCACAVAWPMLAANVTGAESGPRPARQCAGASGLTFEGSNGRGPARGRRSRRLVVWMRGRVARSQSPDRTGSLISPARPYWFDAATRCSPRIPDGCCAVCLCRTAGCRLPCTHRHVPVFGTWHGGALGTFHGRPAIGCVAAGGRVARNQPPDRTNSVLPFPT